MHSLRASAVVISMLVMVAVSPAIGAAEQTLPALKEAFRAPDFELQGEDGKTYRLSDYRGQVVVLNFWATWCPPCRLEMPSMHRAWHKLKGEGVVILAVNVGEDADTIFGFSGDYPVSFPLPMDQDGTVIKQYPVTGLPTTYIISPDGMATHRAVGGREWDAPELLNQLRAMRR
ncbi:MAG: alkyl hydroperoxide reductase [Gammaproteobacteria bacterium SG8_47]|nr:MAG: alkyl hydroperoxide reductase [Gammaproteobacteria bacterium SG8_47]